MSTTRILLIIVMLTIPVRFSRAENRSHSGGHPSHIWNRETLTDGLFGLNDDLADNGIELALSATQVYQSNTKGGLSTDNHRGRYSGSYDLEMSGDLQRLLGIAGLSFYMLAEGSWSDTEGIDATSVGSFFGVNGDAAGDRAFDVTQLWFEQTLLNDALLVRVGKIDLTGGFECRGCPVTFDGSTYANDETSQFLNSALVNNPTIPLPDNGLGLIIYYNPIEWWYASAGVADAQADVRETGFATTFHDEDYFCHIFETGITPQLDSVNGSLQGAYRVGLWYDAQPKANSESNRDYRDDVGFYLSCDQVLIKENTEAQSSQGLGGFFRFGYADGKKNDLVSFWSGGFQYLGLLEGRDEDVIGAGFAQGIFSDKASSTYTDDYESVLEVYYNAQVTPWLHISPSVQYVANPSGNGTGNDAVVLGVRVQMSF